MLKIIFCLSVLVSTFALAAEATSIQVDGDEKILMGDLLVDSNALGAPGVMGVRPVNVELWEDGVLPIVFTKETPKRTREMVWQACKEWSAAANVKCVPGPYKKRKLTVSTKFMGMDNGCWSMFGQGAQFLWLKRRINLGKDCDWYPTVLHELGHSLGIGHEHQRPDRDKYIQMHTENAEGSFLGLNKVVNFWKQKGTPMTEYDFLSIMHYYSHAFSKNDKPTITPRPGYEAYAYVMGRGQHLSESDISMIQQLYGKPKK